MMLFEIYVSRVIIILAKLQTLFLKLDNASLKEIHTYIFLS